MTASSQAASSQKASSQKMAAGARRKRGSAGDADYLSSLIRCLWRQRWLSLISAWAICMLGWLAIALWPSSYVSSAVIYADLHKLPDVEVAPVTRSLNDQRDQDPVQLLREALLTEESLGGLRAAVALGDEEAATLADDILIRATAPTLFVATYHHTNPTTAQSVLDTLFANLSERVNADLAANEAPPVDLAADQADLERRIADREGRLEEADRRLTEFTQLNAVFFEAEPQQSGDIPVLEAEALALRERIDLATAERDEAAGRIAELTLSQPAPNQPPPPEPEPLSQNQLDEIALLEARLVELRERYADTHPYVATVLTAIETIRGPAEAAQASTEEVAGLGGDPTGASEIDEQLAEFKQVHEEKIAEVSQLTNDLASKRREIDRQRALTDSTSSVESGQAKLEGEKAGLEAELASLATEREALQDRAEAQASQESDNGEQTSFRLINEPNLPDKPTGPSRLLCLVLVLVGGVGLASGMAVLRNQSKGVFESAWQLKRRFDVGVLGTISEVMSPNERKRVGKAQLAFAAAGIGLVGAFSGFAIAEFLNVLTPWGDLLRTQLLG